MFGLFGMCASLGSGQISIYCEFNDEQRRAFIECYTTSENSILGIKFTEAMLSCMIGRGGSLYSLLETYCTYRYTSNVLASGIHCLQVNPMASYLAQITPEDKMIMQHTSDACNTEAKKAVKAET